LYTQEVILELSSARPVIVGPSDYLVKSADGLANSRDYDPTADPNLSIGCGLLVADYVMLFDNAANGRVRSSLRTTKAFGKDFDKWLAYRIVVRAEPDIRFLCNLVQFLIH
jgi:hypothetical protein